MTLSIYDVFCLAGLIPSLVIVVASVIYAKSARSTLSYLLLTGATGHFLLGVEQCMFIRIILPHFSTGPGALSKLAQIQQAVGLANLAFSLLFAITLLLVFCKFVSSVAPGKPANRMI
jgi:hypothetical protein